MQDRVGHGRRLAFGNWKGKKAGPPVHGDLGQREFVADAPNRLWLTDITEYKTAEGKLYLCAIKYVFSNNIVGYSIGSRMKSRLVVNAINTRLRKTSAGRHPPRPSTSIDYCSNKPVLHRLVEPGQFRNRKAIWTPARHC
ncbi:Integrase core domain protein [Microbacterium azadirachtae]|uniref:Integrase core domain protein n=1 Tax=Microbacterium azadirachtae TaxID=582680 RepID=A0A0F0L522_9MICO|nr:Integrase core domain protein [Microbacterium azadirachtae]